MTLKPTSNQGSGGGGSGTVTSVSSADTSIAVATGTTTPVLTAAALNTIAGNSATSGDVAMNSHKLTGLAAGSASGNSVRYEQVLGGANALAVNNLVAGTAGQVLGGTGPSYALPPGYEFGYDQITANVTITGTSAGAPTTVITCAAHTFDGGAVIFEFFAPFVTVPGSGGDILQMGLSEGGTSLGKPFFTQQLAAAGTFPGVMRWRFTPSAGSHTFVVYAFGSSATTPVVGAGAGGADTTTPAFARFTKV